MVPILWQYFLLWYKQCMAGLTCTQTRKLFSKFFQSLYYFILKMHFVLDKFYKYPFISIHVWDSVYLYYVYINILCVYVYYVDCIICVYVYNVNMYIMCTQHVQE